MLRLRNFCSPFRLDGFSAALDQLPVLLDQGAGLAFRLDQADLAKQLLVNLRSLLLLANRLDHL